MPVFKAKNFKMPYVILKNKKNPWFLSINHGKCHKMSFFQAFKCWKSLKHFENLLIFMIVLLFFYFCYTLYELGEIITELPQGDMIKSFSNLIFYNTHTHTYAYTLKSFFKLCVLILRMATNTCKHALNTDNP